MSQSDNKTYAVPVEFTFKGEFFIKAASPEQARDFAKQHCGLVLGGNIHSSLPDKDVDWEFTCHPDKLVGNAEEA